MKSLYLGTAPGMAKPASAARMTFEARARTEAERAALRAICATCPDNRAGICRGSTCCGGVVPVEVRLNLTTTRCPKNLWPKQN